MEPNTNDTPDVSVFCSNVDRLVVEDRCEYSNITVEQISTSIESQVRELFEKLSSEKSLELKQNAIMKLKSIFLNMKHETTISESLINDSKSMIIGLLLKEDDNILQKELFLLCVSLIEIINKEEKNKWMVISEVVIPCVALDKYYLTKLVQNWIIDHHFLFGNDHNYQMCQYNLLIINCLGQFTENPKAALFAMYVMKEVLIMYEKSVVVRCFLKTTPLILFAMEQLVATTQYGVDFVKIVNYLFINFPDIFRRHLRKTILTIIGLLYKCSIKNSSSNNKDTETLMVFEIYNCLKTVIVCYHEEIRLQYNRYIPAFIENLLDLKFNSYPDQPKKWFRDNYIHPDIFLSIDDVGFEMCLKAIFFYIGIVELYPFLSSKVEQLLKSSDWKDIAVALDCFAILIKKCGTDVCDPTEVFAFIVPYYFSDNTKMMYSAFKLSETLCSRYCEEKYFNFHKEALSLMIENATSQNHLLVKVEMLHIVGFITRKCPKYDYDINPNGIIQLFVEVMEAVRNTDDKYLMRYMISSIYRNIECIHLLLEQKMEPHVSRLIGCLLSMFDKIYFTSGLDYSIHDVVNCVVKVIYCYSSDDVEDVIFPIVAYINDFNASHNLSTDLLEIQPCFFSLIEVIIKYKTKCVETLLQKLGHSCVKYFDAIKQLIMKSSGIFRDDYPIPRPFGCGFCFIGANDGGIRSICSLASIAAKNYGGEFSPFVQMLIEVVHDILMQSDDEYRHVDLTRGLFKLLNCAIIYGDVEATRKLWVGTLKNSFFQIMKDSSDQNILGLFKNFIKCITISGFNDALGASDVESVSRILNDTMITGIHQVEAWLASRNPYNQKSTDTSDYNELLDGSTGSEVESTLDKLLICLENFEKVYGGVMGNAMIPMFKTLLDYKPSNQSEIFFKFLLFVIGDIANHLDPKSTENQELFPLVLDLSFTILIEYPGYTHLPDVSPIILKLKDMFSKPFEQRFELLDPTTKSNIEKILVKDG